MLILCKSKRKRKNEKKKKKVEANENMPPTPKRWLSALKREHGSPQTPQSPDSQTAFVWNVGIEPKVVDEGNDFAAPATVQGADGMVTSNQQSVNVESDEKKEDDLFAATVQGADALVTAGDLNEDIVENHILSKSLDQEIQQMSIDNPDEETQGAQDALLETLIDDFTRQASVASSINDENDTETLTTGTANV